MRRPVSEVEIGGNKRTKKKDNENGCSKHKHTSHFITPRHSSAWYGDE